MLSHQTLFAGIDLSSGHKPVTYAALDRELNVSALEKWSVSNLISCLKDYDRVVLAITLSTKDATALTDFKKELFHLKFSPLSHQSGSHQFIETKAVDCYQMLTGSKLLSGRTFEGRIQRALILYEEGFQIPDPMDLFEEITRHKLIQGMLPIESLYSAKELDALVAAYVAWMTANRPNQIDFSSNNVVLPKPVEN